MTERSQNVKVLTPLDGLKLAYAARNGIAPVFRTLHGMGDRLMLQPPSFGLNPPSSYLLFHPQDVVATWVENQTRLDKEGPVFEDLRSLGGDNLLLMRARNETNKSEKWKTRQMLIGRRTQPKGLEGLKAGTKKATEEMLDGWGVLPDKEKIVPDLYKSLKDLGFKVSAQFLLGKEASQEEVEGVSASMVSVHKFLVLNAFGGRLPTWIYQRAPSLFREFKQANKYLSDYADGIADTNTQSPLIQALIEAASKDPKEQNPLNIRNEILGIINTSFVTIASSTAWTMYLLSLPQNIKHQDSARDEARGGVNVESPKSFTYKALQESLRLFPPVYGGFRKATSDIDIETVNGRLFVPEQSNLGINPYMTHRDPRFWSNPEQFDPERFLEKPVNGSYIAFGLGERRCIGEHYAMYVATNIVGAVLERYKLSIVQFPDLEFSSQLKPTPNGAVKLTPI